ASIDRYIQGATFVDNRAALAGGAVSLECLGGCGGDATFDIDFSTFDGNGFSVADSATAGGAVYSTADALEVTGSTFLDNTSGGNGGAIAALTASVDGSTFQDNRSGLDGGAMDLADGGQVVNSTFTGNGLGGAGTYGGLAIRSQGDLDLTYVTIADQYYLNADTGSVLLVDGGDLTLTNSLIDEDDTPVGVDDAGDRCVVTGATSGTGTITTTSTCPGTVETSAEVDLQPLADNGGPTETRALGVGSVAIDVDPCVPGLSDQRGAVRPYGDGTAADPCDAGAYEAYYTVTTSQVSLTDVPAGSTVDDDVTIEGYYDLSGFFDPDGTVQFSYCYSATPPAPTWPCTATDIGTPVAVTGNGDGTASASLSDALGGEWDPAATADGDGPGYYLFHAEFVSDGTNFYQGSEDDGTNESFTYDIAMGVDTTTTTRVSQSQITFGQSVRDVATVEAQEGTDDPTGDVEFSYCWDASAWPTWGSCTPVAISTVTLSAGTLGDAKASAQTGLFTPSGVGYYLFHAEYLGDTGFNGSEDDGTNERLLVTPAPTFVDLTSGTYFATGTSSVGLTAALSAPSGCLSGRTVTFWYDPEGDGTYQTQIGDPATTNGSGVATATANLPTPVGGIYEVEERVDATTNCLDTANTATIVVAGVGDAANGGGHYVNGGRVNFGVTVQVKTNPKTGAVTVTGQMTWHKQGGYRLKGTVTSYSKLTACPGIVTTVGATCAQISGTASYYRWDGGARRWVLVSTGIGYRIIVADGGTATVCVKKTCSTTLKPDWFRMDVPSAVIAGESTEPIQLKGGGISLK
ncbi:MAG: choice-of-anchor Q domain-containing protein, partial [Actinomycetota bacterium]